MAETSVIVPSLLVMLILMDSVPAGLVYDISSIFVTSAGVAGVFVTFAVGIASVLVGTSGKTDTSGLTGVSCETGATGVVSTFTGVLFVHPVRTRSDRRVATEIFFCDFIEKIIIKISRDRIGNYQVKSIFICKNPLFFYTSHTYSFPTPSMLPATFILDILDNPEDNTLENFVLEVEELSNLDFFKRVHIPENIMAEIESKSQEAEKSSFTISTYCPFFHAKRLHIIYIHNKQEYTKELSDILADIK